MIEQKFKDICTEELMKGALIHDAHTGFKEDYLVLHCLLRKYKPKSIFEVGTNTGSGVNVMATALPEAKIYSLDLDYDTMMRNSKQYPVDAKGNDRVGSAVRFPYTQLRGDSLTFDYSKYPCEAAFIDGEHDYPHPYHEAKYMIKNHTRLIIFHDADIPEVNKAIIDAFLWPAVYDVYRVIDTRIAYAIC